MQSSSSASRHSLPQGEKGTALRIIGLKATLNRPFDGLKANGMLLIPFVVSLSNHDRNLLLQRCLTSVPFASMVMVAVVRVLDTWRISAKPDVLRNLLGRQKFCLRKVGLEVRFPGLGLERRYLAQGARQQFRGHPAIAEQCIEFALRVDE